MRNQGCERVSLERRKHPGQVRKPFLEKEMNTVLKLGNETREGSRADNQQGKRLCGDSESNIKSLK